MSTRQSTALHGFFSDVFSVACVLTVWTLAASGAPLTERQALDRLSVWMDGHPVMGCVAGRAIASTVIFPESGSAYSVYVVVFSPAGYAVLNSDDRLPLTVAFSASASVSLADRPDNAFRAALLSHAEQAALTLGGMDERTAPDQSYRRAAGRAPLSVEQCGPYLTTTWNQTNPYNLSCPVAPGAPYGYGGRAPAGCVPVAYGQVLNYHRWPIRGQGTHSYTDYSGDVTGTHSAHFGVPFDWTAMQSSYDIWAVSQPGDVEVADLIYRLGVAADADYESDGTSSSIETLGSRINMHLFYEPVTPAGTQAELLSSLDDNLYAGDPAIIGIPGHAVVADGLLKDGGTVSYHICYGWGGVNDGWWSASSVPGGPFTDGCTGIRPMLMAFPTKQAVTSVAGDPVTLEWLLPVRREQEAERIQIQRLTPQAGTWSSDASTLEHAVSSGWEISPSGRSGSCWFAGPNGPKTLTLTDLFVPNATASLTFWLKFQLTAAMSFRVAVSSDGGETYTTLFERTNAIQANWGSHTVGLGAYAGEQIQVRFELTRGLSYYTNGGVWLDDLSVTSGTWSRWMPFAEDTTLASRRYSEQRELLDNCADFTGFEVTSTETYKDWTISTDSGVDHCFYKQAGGYWDREYHLTANAPVTPGAGTRLLMRWKYMFYMERFRVMVSSDRSTFTEIWSTDGTSDWTEQAIPLGAYAGQSIYLRLEYVPESYYTEGGVWIDTLWLQEVEYPELEGQPVHVTLLTDPFEAGSYTLASVVKDANGAFHTRSPAFTLNVVASRFAHRLEPGGSVTLTNYYGSDQRLEIPSEWEGGPVSGIAANTFAGTPVVSVILPASITTIETGAFAGAASLQRLFFAGDAPSVAANALEGSNVTVYYLPGRTGWSSSLGGRPALLWNPAGTGLGFLNGIFSFTLTGTALIPVHVQATTNLQSAVWFSLTNTVIDGSGAVKVSDPESPAHDTRFYRFVWP
ncbi:MAG TPA: C10 family peptidase [Kiritimatiellia bacterium]|nr:C10 family peptidase [Kiritimatiellia bacterium]HRU70108.1 C10 family peptidase [Kiritimatiellia bacterium]